MGWKSDLIGRKTLFWHESKKTETWALDKAVEFVIFSINKNQTLLHRGGNYVELKRLFTPMTIKGMELNNRVIMPALHHMVTLWEKICGLLNSPADHQPCGYGENRRRL